MSKFRNQAASAVLSVVTVVSLMGGSGLSVAHGASAADLQAQITALLATISGLQSQLSALPGGSASSYTYTRDLTLGSTGADVMNLQKFLNGNGAMVAASGTGSAGSESSYFGAKTKAAVAVWQGAHGVSPASGYFGPKTRAAVNAAVVVAPPAAPAPGAPPAPPAAPAPGAPPAPPAAPAPGAPPAPGTCSSTGEGSMVITLAATPAANPNAFTGSAIPVYGIQVKALNSDIVVDRVNLQLVVTNGATTYLPSSFITEIQVWDGTTKLTSVPVNASTLTTDSSYAYSVSIGGINFKVMKDQTRSLTFSVNTVPTIDNNRTFAIYEYGSNSMRAHDCSNLSIYDASLNSTTYQRSHTFKAGGVSTLTLSVASDNQLDHNIYIDGSAGAVDTEMLRFIANAQTADATLLTLAVSSSFTSIEPSVYKLYDTAGTLLASAATTTSAGNVIFTNVNTLVPVNTYKGFVVKGDFVATGNGSVASITIPAAGVSLFRKADGTTAAPTVSSAINGNPVHAYREVALLTFVSGSATKNVATYTSTGGSITSSSVDGVLTFKVTAKGGTLTLPTSGMFVMDVVSGSASTIATIAGGAGAVSVDRTTNVADGDTATVTLSARQLSSAAGISGSGGEFLHYILTRFNWTVGATAGLQTWGTTLYKTPDVFLP